MKLSTRLGLIVASAILGLIVVAFVALHTLHANMLADRRDEIQTVLSLARHQVAYYQSLEQSGKLDHKTAQDQAIAALSGLRDGKNYLWARTTDALGLVHPNPAVIGKVDWGAKVASGRSNFEEYLFRLRDTDYAFFDDMTKRPGTDVLVPKINGVTRIDGWNWLVGFGVFVDDIEHAYWQLVWHFVLIGVLGLLVVSALAFVMSRHIYRQLGGEPDYAAQVARAIAAGDLTRSLGQFSRSRPDSLLGSMATMQQSLRGMIEGIQQGAQALAQAAGNLTNQIEQIRNASRQSSDATASTAAAIEQMSVSIDQISHSARETEKNSTRTTVLAGEGEELVGKVSMEINGLLTEVNAASDLIAGLVERSREIGGVSGEIKEIADQTNLLALNAAIEAARAGEHGRGFAVVADEVRKLAERTSQATGRIGQMVDAIRTDTDEVVNSMHAVTPRVSGSVHMAGEAAHALQAISADANANLERVRDVANAASEQSMASNSVAVNVERISQMVEGSAASVQIATQNVQELQQLATGLRQSVSRFQL
ncbi:methyl-accepting chemotaxis protein [Silvimonas amylolytica]|uniref:Methyl-accepting chemotaxis protein n=1 Tax=Silvimonas amylolytica TaxID=449663 RepID=A0ABQ2PI29_9NEIS|nr:methyl-accepting chemotaxis protein [Silvimonas amylolytica]GGP24629.1 methyl-accepting chemotaxis protein [Silvimonas amylolytica]